MAFINTDILYGKNWRFLTNICYTTQDTQTVGLLYKTVYCTQCHVSLTYWYEVQNPIIAVNHEWPLTVIFWLMNTYTRLRTGKMQHAILQRSKMTTTNESFAHKLILWDCTTPQRRHAEYTWRITRSIFRFISFVAGPKLKIRAFLKLTLHPIMPFCHIITDKSFWNLVENSLSYFENLKYSHVVHR